MKLRLNFPPFSRDNKLRSQKGQSLIEFVLLLAVISAISYGFVGLINTNLVKNWEKFINIVVTDSPDTIKYKID